ncbi:MAG TPA: hypothetical protein VMW02_01235 [Thermoplasmata archaeon]|nr:hypothetical protein [Thermoplasmata archaeon]
MANPVVLAARIEALLKSRYRQVPSDDNEKIINSVLRFWLQVQEGKLSKDSLLQEVVEIIHRSLMFQEIAIALKDPNDGLYRYQTFTGFTKDAIEDMRSLVYTDAEVRAFDRLPGIRVSKLIEFTISEAPLRAGEEAQFNRPILAAMHREADDEFTFGDYMNIYIRGRDDELLGFIEVSGPRDGKLPSGNSMKGLELIAIMTGNALQCLRGREKIRRA